MCKEARFVLSQVFSCVSSLKLCTLGSVPCLYSQDQPRLGAEMETGPNFLGQDGDRS